MIKNAQKLKKMFSDNPETYEANLTRVIREKEMDVYNISVQDIARSFLGDNYEDDVALVPEVSTMRRFERASGTQVLPSAFAHISGFDATMAGLVGQLAMDGYALPTAIGDDFCTTIPTRVNGGKFIMPTNTTDEGVNLTINEPYPSATLSETYVTRPVNKRNGLSIELSRFDYIYDLTGKIQETAVAAGERIRMNRERQIGLMALGISNTYSRDGISGNTYLTSATTTAAYNLTTPMNYVNAVASMATYTALTADDLFNIKVLLGRNTNPATGYPVQISPYLEAKASQAVRSTQVFAADTTGIQAASGRLFQGDIGVKVVADVTTSQFWYNLLVEATATGGAGLTDDTTHAKTVCLLGDPKKAFAYLEVWPFNVAAAPLSSEDAKRDITAVYIASEVGVPCIKEPRFMARFYNTWS
jgi:hypothetical protein